MDSSKLWAYLVYSAPFISLYLLFIATYLLIIISTYKLVAQHNRQINIKLIWVSFIPIPIVGSILSFIIMKRIANSLELEYKERGIPFTSKPTYNTGTINAIGSIALYLRLFGGYSVFVSIGVLIAYYIDVIYCGRVLRSNAPVQS